MTDPPLLKIRVAVLAAPGKFEVKRFGALETRNDGMALSFGGYFVSNFSGSAYYLNIIIIYFHLNGHSSAFGIVLATGGHG